MGSVPLQEWREGRLVWSTTGVRREKAAACSLGEGPHWSPAVGHLGGRHPAPRTGSHRHLLCAVSYRAAWAGETLGQDHLAEPLPTSDPQKWSHNKYSSL